MGRRTIVVEEPELPFPPHAQVCPDRLSPWATFDGCPMCGGTMAPEHAHYRCGSCGWRDSCCD
jgi:hypothetical protein